jgi:hypothetical protein
MKGYRFYEEFDSSYKKRKHQGSGNVLALDLDCETGRPYGWVDAQGRYVMECTAAVLSESNSPVCGTAVSRDVLAKNYRKISEAKARQIHPAMFAFLDMHEADEKKQRESA